MVRQSKLSAVHANDCWMLCDILFICKYMFEAQVLNTPEELSSDAEYFVCDVGPTVTACMIVDGMIFRHAKAVRLGRCKTTRSGVQTELVWSYDLILILLSGSLGRVYGVPCWRV